MEKTALYCGRCLGFRGYADGWLGDVIEWIPACDWCLSQMAGRNGRLAGTLPAVCLQCGEPFEATRQAQKFCSPACRARSWRDHRAAADS